MSGKDKFKSKSSKSKSCKSPKHKSSKSCKCDNASCGSCSDAFPCNFANVRAVLTTGGLLSITGLNAPTSSSFGCKSCGKFETCDPTSFSALNSIQPNSIAITNPMGQPTILSAAFSNIIRNSGGSFMAQVVTDPANSIASGASFTVTLSNIAAGCQGTIVRTVA